MPREIQKGQNLFFGAKRERKFTTPCGKKGEGAYMEEGAGEMQKGSAPLFL